MRKRLLDLVVLTLQQNFKLTGLQLIIESRMEYLLAVEYYLITKVQEEGKLLLHVKLLKAYQK